MRILFVYSVADLHSHPKPLRGPDHIQFGISYISSVLKMHGHETSLIVLGRSLGERNGKVIDRRLDEYCPHLVCLTAVSSEYPFIEKMARYIRERAPAAFLLIGGVHVSLDPRDEMLSVFDALCVGEGEYPTLELVTQLAKNEEPSNIQNLWIRRGGTIQKNSPRPFLEDLDSLPLPDRHMWLEWTDIRRDSRHTVVLGRGCPFGCTFCSNHALRKLSPGPYVRLRSVGGILDEVRDLKAANPGMREIYLEVESFVTYLEGGRSDTNIEWALEICDGLAHLNRILDEPLSFGVNLRIAPEVDFDRLFAACGQANVSYVNVGLESGSERIRRRVLNRRYSNDDVRRVVASARRHGLRIVFYNMVGLPGETPVDFQETVRINRECEPDWYHLQIFYPYPGTDLHKVCAAEGWIQQGADVLLERSTAVVNQPGFNCRQVQSSFTWFDYYVNWGKKPLWKILLNVSFRWLHSHPRLFYLYRRLTWRGPLRRLKEAAKRA